MPSSSPLFPGRRLRIGHWSAEPRVASPDTLGLETHLARLGDVDVVRLKALDAPEASPCDLVIVAAQTIPKDGFAAWLDALRQRFVAHGNIWVPALILADVPFDVLSEMLTAARENWYFDILAPAHVSSLPIRVANLLRIHDHLHEMKRYAAALDDITTKVKMLESQMRDLRAAPAAERKA